MKKYFQSFLIPTLFLSIVNVAYTFLVVGVLQSWLLTWHLDRRFPFSMIPLWAFCLVSIAIGIASLFYLSKAKNQPKWDFDKFNKFLIYTSVGLFVWIIIAIMLTHTYYIGDFNLWSVLHAIVSGKAPIPFVEVPLESVDVVPTLGDSIFIAYGAIFVLLYLANLRGLESQLVSQEGAPLRSLKNYGEI